MAASISLYERFLEIPDSRHRSGQRHPLAAILTLTAVAILGGSRSLDAIAQFARDRGPHFTRLLGFTRPRGPCKGTLSNVFGDLDRAAVERAIAGWLEHRRQAGWEAVALDGKTARGSREGDLPGVHLLTAYAHEAREPIAQMRVDAKTNEHKQALELLEVLPLEGKVVTGDAMFCKRDLSRKVLEKGGIMSGRSRTISRSSSRRSPTRSRILSRPRPRSWSAGSKRPNASSPRRRTRATAAWSTAGW